MFGQSQRTIVADRDEPVKTVSHPKDAPLFFSTDPGVFVSRILPLFLGLSAVNLVQTLILQQPKTLSGTQPSFAIIQPHELVYR